MRAQAEPAGRSCRSQIRQGGGGGAGGRGGAACGSRGRRGGHARAGAPRGRAPLQARARAAGAPAAGAPAPQHIADLRPWHACNCLLQERQLPKRCRHVERCNIRKLHPADVLVAPPACERMQVACRWQPTTIASSAASMQLPCSSLPARRARRGRHRHWWRRIPGLHALRPLPAL